MGGMSVAAEEIPLPNGERASRYIVDMVWEALKWLYENWQQPTIALLHFKCINCAYQLSEQQNEALQDLNLFDEEGRVVEGVCKVVLACVVAEGGGMRLISPYSKKR